MEAVLTTSPGLFAHRPHNVLYNPRRKRPAINHECAPFGNQRLFLLRFRKLENTTTANNGRRIGHLSGELYMMFKDEGIVPDSEAMAVTKQLLKELEALGYIEVKDENYWYITAKGHAYR